VSHGGRRASLGYCGDIDVMPHYKSARVTSPQLEIIYKFRGCICWRKGYFRQMVRPAVEFATIGNLRWRPRLEAGGTTVQYVCTCSRLLESLGEQSISVSLRTNKPRACIEAWEDYCQEIWGRSMLATNKQTGRIASRQSSRISKA
jgi:hypothetical protein